MTFYETEVLPFTPLLPFFDHDVNRVSHSLLTSPEFVHSRELLFLQDEEHQNPHSASGKRNMLYSSTTVASGRCKAVVTGTGANTEIGKIAKAIDDEEDEKTPLGKKIDAFGNSLTYVIAGICVLVWVMNIKNFDDPLHGSWFKGCIYYLKIAVALGVAAIPEGLPAVIT